MHCGSGCWLFFFVLYLVAAPAVARAIPTTEWFYQFETASGDAALGLATDGAGNAYVVGITDGNALGENGYDDAFVSKFDSNGSLLWTRQFGTASSDEAWGVEVDSNGNAYVTGSTGGALYGPHVGGEDSENAFLVKYDTDGTKQWGTQFGGAWSQGSSVALAGDGTSYVIGSAPAGFPTSDAFLSKRGANGEGLWTQSFSTPGSERGSDVAIDAAGNVYVTGTTNEDLYGINAGVSPFIGGAEDVFLAKIDSDGNEIWGKQIGVPGPDGVGDLAIDSEGSVYLAGHEFYAAALIKMDLDGNEVWSQTAAVGPASVSGSVAVDGAGNIYVAGTDTENGGHIARLTQFGADGTVLWDEQAPSGAFANGVSLDGDGNMWVAGGTAWWGGDVFLWKLTGVAPIPEPTTALLLTLGLAGLGMRRRR